MSTHIRVLFTFFFSSKNFAGTPRRERLSLGSYFPPTREGVEGQIVPMTFLYFSKNDFFIVSKIPQNDDYIFWTPKIP
jgi:hypothetical protein